MEKEKERIRENLARNLELYVKTMLSSKYSEYIPEIRQKELKEIYDFKEKIRIEDTGTISLYVSRGMFYFPESAFKILKAMKFIPGYGVNKNHKSFEKETLIENNNTFLDYIMHVFVAGLDVEDYYQENLLHETMHFCGVGGASALSEGIAEYITRKVAEEYSFLTSGCGYPKEIKIVLELEKIFNQETIIKMAFSKNNQEIRDLLEKEFGEEAYKFYMEIARTMESEFSKKYHRYRFPGIMGPLKKASKYDDIDYSEVYKKIAEYKERTDKKSKS